MMVMATTRGNCVPQCKASAARWRIDRSAQQLRRNAVLELCRACSCPAPPRPGLDSRPRPGHHRGCCNGLKLSVTTDRMLTTDDILHAFAKARGVPPLAAVRQAISRWEEVRPYLVARLEAIVATGDRSDDAVDLACYGFYVMAQQRDTSAFRLLCRLALDNVLIDAVFSDAVTDEFPCMLVRTYDGDAAPLRTLIESADTDQFTRDAGIEALAWLTASGRLDRDNTVRYLGELLATMQPRGRSHVWAGWQGAVAGLGLDAFAEPVRGLFDSGWIDPTWLGFADFQEDLALARSATDPLIPFARRLGDMASFDGVAAMIAKWYQPAKRKVATARPATTRPVRGQGDVTRKVGRNDPCPCGSGKKFKKCRLGKAG